MAKNLVPEIAKMLGVEIGEEFKCYSTYNCITHKLKLENDGLYYAQEMCLKDSNGNKKILTNWIVCSTADKLFRKILSGDYEIIKLPWKPKENELYYTFNYIHNPKNWVVEQFSWEGAPIDEALFKSGWVYRTLKEAQAALPAVAKEQEVEYEI